MIRRFAEREPGLHLVQRSWWRLLPEGIIDDDAIGERGNERERGPGLAVGYSQVDFRRVNRTHLLD